MEQVWERYKKTLSIIYNKKIHIQNIVHWIKNADKILKEEIEERQKEVKSKEIKILEMNELFTYIKKNPKILMEKNIVIKEYGLLLTFALFSSHFTEQQTTNCK